MASREPRQPLLPGWDDVPNGRGDPRPEGPPPTGTFGLRILTVSQASRTIREQVRAHEGLRDLWVEGEIGRVTVSAAGHAYFSLKDARAQLQCVWFRDDRVRSPFEPQTGLQVVAHGRIDLFEPQGALQLYVESLQPSGFGDLAIRFEQLKARLGAEGLFDAARKRPLPVRPATIAVVTSPSGAVWRDVCNVLARRWPLARVVLVACQVQGEGAPASIVTALDRVGRWIGRLEAEGRPDEAPAVTILARGGGSLEDLWAFNDERVVRAIVGHAVPVVCGVGHEVDVTLADFAADVRAPTPSAAAELVVPDRTELAAAIAALGRRAAGTTGARLAGARRELATEARVLDRVEPRAQLGTSRERADLLLDRAARLVGEHLAAARAGNDRALARLAPLAERRLAAARAGLAASAAALGALGPEATLRRGYAIARRLDDGAILREPAQAPAGTRLEIALAGGRLGATSAGSRSSHEASPPAARPAAEDRP